MAAAKLCLKARPTATQLRDRLQPVDGRVADGLELYLAAVDLATSAAMDGVVERLESADLPADFALLIEGPVDSLDGGDFDVTRESDADAEVVKRLADLAKRIRARAVNIHLIAPSADTGRLTLECREALLRKAVPFMRQFADAMHAAHTVPTIENMPAVLRMRRQDFAFTPIGMCSADLNWMVEQVFGLKVLVDTSHAGLYLNARHTQHEFDALATFTRQLPPDGSTVLEYVQAFGGFLENAQISNASGVLGEGLGYGDGEIDLDPVLAWLSEHTRYIVTETLEANNDEAVEMRVALRRMRAVAG